MENSDKLGLVYDVLIQMPSGSSSGNRGSTGTSSATRFSRSAAPGKHHKVMDADDIATFRKVLFSNFSPSSDKSATDAHLTGDGVHQAAGTVRPDRFTDEHSAQVPPQPSTTKARREEGSIVRSVGGSG